MRYDLYFHNDFDGHASAAVFLAYLKSRRDTAQFSPVDHDLKAKWEAMKFKNPSAIFDFYFHPKATFWIDHHGTTFITPKLKRQYKKTKYHQFSFKYYSCCHLVYDVLKRDFDFKPAVHFKELIEWLDVIDSARYTGPEQEIEAKDPAIQIGQFIDAARGKRKLNWLIEFLATKPLVEIVRDRRIRSAIIKAKKERSRVLDFYQKNLEIHGKVSYLDLTKTKFRQIDVAPFYLVPDLVYSITLKKKGKVFSFSLRGNPWRRNQIKIHLGNLLRKECNGGGHPAAAGCEVGVSSKVAYKLASKLVEYLKA